MSEGFKRYKCFNCGVIYDEAEGLPDDGIATGKARGSGGPLSTLLHCKKYIAAQHLDDSIAMSLDKLVRRLEECPARADAQTMSFGP